MGQTTNYKNHFGRGGVNTHPLFDWSYLPENIASFIETLIFLVLDMYILLFIIDLSAIYFHLDNLITAIAADFVHPILTFFQIPHNYSGLGAVSLVLVGICFLISRYFNYVKYNLHPKTDVY